MKRRSRYQCHDCQKEFLLHKHQVADKHAFICEVCKDKKACEAAIEEAKKRAAEENQRVYAIFTKYGYFTCSEAELLKQYGNLSVRTEFIACPEKEIVHEH